MPDNIQITDWQNCYPSNWKGVIVPEAMAHPAKYSSKLIRRIYEHMFEMGWLKAGDRVVDPFGGVALGALDAMRLGLDWTGNELEPRFVDLGNQNIDLWNTKYGRMPGWGSARLFNGDSRRLLEVIGAGVQASVSSPPYADGSQHTGGNDPHPEKLQGGIYHGVGIAGAVSSPPYAETDVNYKRNGLKENGKTKYERPYMQRQDDHYGSTSGQLGAMKADGFDVTISSPPFLQSEGGVNNAIGDEALMRRHAAGNKSSNAYGESDGQLSSMKDGGFGAAVASPPYAEARIGQESGQEHCGHGDQYGESRGQLGAMNAEGFEAAVSSPPYADIAQSGGTKGLKEHGTGLTQGDICFDEYGSTAGQLGRESVDDFWLAARAIVEQVYLALTPGGHAVWVVKDYVKNKQIVPFSDQWRQLCEAVGFVTLHEHHAMLVHHKGSQHTLDGNLIEHKTESKSFFRRLAEKKGSPRIDWETVYCMVKGD
jgi:hypothetical protein